MMLRKAILIILLLCGVLPAFALSEDFTASSQNSILTLCPCTSIEDTITIQNQNFITESKTYTVEDGTVTETSSPIMPASTYSITTGGENGVGGWAKAVPDIVTLNVGQTAQLKNIITAPCDAGGEYKLITTITTGEGAAKELSQALNVQSCLNLELNAIVSQQKTCPCTPAVFSFSIKNTGTFSESYEIGIDHELAEYATLSESPVSLAPQESRVVYLYVNAPCEAYGIQEIPVVATAKSTRQNLQIAVEADFDRECYDYNVKIGAMAPLLTNESTAFKEGTGSYEMCGGESRIIPALIAHPSDIPNIYYATFKGNEWAMLDIDEFMLDKNQQTFVRIILTPGIGVNESAILPFGITTERGDYTKKGDIRIKVEECYTPEIEKNIAYINYSGILNIFSVANKGTKKAQYNISLEGEEWISIEPAYITLKAGEEKKINVKTTPGEEALEGDYTAKLIFTAQNNVAYEKELVFKLRKPSMLLSYLSYGFIGLVLLIIILLAMLKIKKRQMIKKEEKKEVVMKAEAEKKKPAKAARKEERPLKEEKMVLRITWKSALYVIIAVGVIALIAAGVIFREQITQTILPLISANETLEIKPVITAPEQQPGEPITLNKIKEAIKGVKIPYLRYILSAIAILAVIIIIIELLRRKAKRKTEGKKAAEEKAEPEEEIKEEIREEKKEERKEAKKEAKIERREGIKHWKLYLLIIGVLAIMLAGWLLWPQIQQYALNFTEINLTKIVSGVVEPVKIIISRGAEEPAKEAEEAGKSYLTYAIYGIAILAIIIILLEIIRKMRKGRQQRVKTAEERAEWEKAEKEKKAKEAEKAREEKAAKKEIKKEERKEAKKEERKGWKGLSFFILIIIVIGVILGARQFMGWEEADEAPAEKDTEAEATVEKEAAVEKGAAAEAPIIEEITKPIAEAKECAITWEKDTAYTIELSDAFKDPDMDALFFSSTKPEDVNVEIEGSEAVLTPRKGFTGQREIEFSASDGKGGTVTSGSITLCINEGTTLSRAYSKARQAGKTITNYIKEHQAYIIAGIAIAIALVLLITYYRPIIDYLEEDDKTELRNRDKKGKK